MRIWFAVFVCGLLIVAWGPADAAEAKLPLCVATFRCDITPPLGHRLTLEPLKTVEHPLEAKGIVLEDGEKRYVLCSLDWCIVSNDAFWTIRDAIAEAAETPVENVCVQTVHQHTAPIIDTGAVALLEQLDNPPKPLGADPKFVDDVAERIGKAVAKSLHKFEEFDRIGMGQAKVEKVASARRILRDNGRTMDPRFSYTKNPEVRNQPEGQIDPYLKTISLARGYMPIVRLHYYAVHPQSWYRDGRASIDFVGLAREAMEHNEGVFHLYFTGCAGNITVGKYNDGKTASRDRFQKALMKAMKQAISSTDWAPAKEIDWRSVPLSLPVRTDRGHSEAELRRFMANKKAKPDLRGRAARWLNFARRQDRPINVNTLRIGNAYILHLPGEPFLDFQLFAQQLRPDDFVAVAGYGDGGPCYICDEAAFAEGGYEPTASVVKPESEQVMYDVIRKSLMGP